MSSYECPYQGFFAGSMFEYQSNGIAWYNSLQASLNKRFSHGLQFLASYTFSRDLANVFGSTRGPNGGQVFGDNNNPRSNYGPDILFVRIVSYLAVCMNCPDLRISIRWLDKCWRTGNFQESLRFSRTICFLYSITPGRTRMASRRILLSSFPDAVSAPADQ